MAVMVMAVPTNGGPVQAGEGEWIIRVEPVFMEAQGHDQHVLNVHETDFDLTPQVTDKSAVTLDTEGGVAYRCRFQYVRGRWGWGVDSFLFYTSQVTPERTDAAGGAVDEVVYEVADRNFTSTAPDETLYYRVLEDTDLETWTADLYGERTMVEKEGGAVRMLFGLRVGDFDNDYRAVAGIQDVEGRRLDASSNYGLLVGPLVGMSAEIRFGQQRIDGYFSQSLILGTAELSSMSTEFTGPFSETPAFTVQERITTTQDVAIPVTEFRIKWAYGVTKKLALGVGVDTAVWWDVSVPPGVIPVEDGDGLLHENTIVYHGLSAFAEYRF
jgi:hypothetical protein